jgi:hypothetical protein
VDTYQFECPQNDIINCIDVITEVINSIFFLKNNLTFIRKDYSVLKYNIPSRSVSQNTNKNF